MASLTLKVLVSGSNATKTMQFDPSLIIYDACRIIRDKLPDASSTNANEYGLFLSDDDPKKGVWLEPGRTLEYYLLRNGDLLEYKKKHRMLRVRMLDGAIKTMQVDDSHTVSQLMITICSKIGITNHEEYSLVRDLPDAEKEKTLTLRRDKSIAKDQKKMDEMKKKLHTDDELNWMDHTKTLREQAVEPSETLLLRRKYFFSDQNVDARDPIQLNLLYVQTRDAILKGAHPINQEEAVQFGGIQCQIQFGDHVEGKHRPGFLDLKEFLPKEYVKVKGIEKKIFLEHKKLQGISEVDSKVKYNNLARSLKTYGIAFFLVKEKLKGKNRLVPRLLGVTKDSVVRVDEKTKEILKTWPLTTVRRWAASPNSFTLDFGDYSDSYYSVQTMEGEQISQLISGYIDIILKRKAAKDHIGMDGEEESTMYEDSVAPARATIIQHQISKVGHANTGSVALNTVMRSGGNGDGGLPNGGSMQKALYTQVSSNHNAMNGHAGYAAAPQITMLTQSQRALLGTINEGLTTVDESHQDLSSKAELPPLGTDAASSKWKETTKDLSRQKVGSQLSAMNAATAQMVTLTSAGPDETDFTAVGSAVQTISANIGEFSKDVKMLAALDESSSSGEKILDAARRLAGAFSCLLTAAQPGSQEPRQTLLNAATKVGEAGQEVMGYVEPPTPNDDSYKDTLLALAKAVANATATLVMKAKGVASTCDNQSDQNIIIGAATQCALSTSQLVACTKVVAPTLSSSSECQGQLVEAAKQVAKTVDDVVETAQNICDNDVMLKDLGEAATSVTVTLDDMMQHVRKASNRNIADNDEVDVILTTTDRLYNSVGDTPEMVKQARQLALATSQLVNALKTEAESHQDTDQQRKLLAAAKLLADATAKMVEAAKGCASTPHDPTQQEALMRAAEELKKVTNDAAHTKSRTSVFTILQEAVKRATSASTQLINASGAAGKSNRNQSSQQQLMMMCKQVAEDSIPKAIQSLRTTLKSPDSPNSLALLIAAAHDMLQPCSKMLSCAKASVPTVGDQAAAMSLSNASSILANAIVDLRQAVTKARESFTPHDLDAALLRVRDLEHDLVEVKRSARERGLVPLPGETPEVCASKLGSTSKIVGSTLARLLTAAAQGNESYTGQAAKETAESLSTLMQVIRGVAATSSQDLQQEVLNHGMEVLEKSDRLIEEAKLAIINPSNPDNQAKLAMVAKGISQALNNCVGCLPGLKEVDDAVRYISTVSIQLSQPQLNAPTATKSNYTEVQIHLTSKAADLNSATSEVVSAAVSASSHQVATASDRFSKAYEQLVVTGLEAARNVPKDTESQEKIVTGLRGVSSVSGRLLVAVKSMLVDPNAPNAKNQLTQAARAVTESINNLISVCTVSSPGQKECDNALRQIEMMKPLLQEPNEPIMDSNYYDCLEGVITKSKNLADTMTGMSSQAKQKDLNSFCTSVSEFASSVCGIVEYVAQAAYLIGTSDPASEPGRPGLVDQSQFFRSQQAIQSACQNLTNPANNQQQILSAAATIAKNTSSLCNTCRLASSKTNNPVAKRHFVQSAKEVANNTANLVRAIKNLDKEFTEENRLACSEASRPLLQAVESLSAFAASPEFVGIPAKISSQAGKAQEPITSAGLLIIESACNMLLSAKQLAACPKDPAYFQGYSSHSHFLSEAIKKMVTSIKEGIPGGVECDNALQHINMLIQQIDSASLSPGSTKYDPRLQLSTASNHQELILNSARQLFDHIDPIASAAKSEPESLGHVVTSATTYLEPLSSASLSYTSKIFNTRSKEMLIDQTRTVIEAMQNLIMIVRDAGGNQKTTTASHQLIDESSESTKETLLELIQTVQNISTSSGVMNGLVDDVTRAMTMLNDQNFLVKRRSYVDHQTDIVRLSKQMARNAQEMMSKSLDNVSEFGNLATQISRDFCALALDAREAADCSADIQTSLRIKSVVQQLGNSCVDLIQDAGDFQSKPDDEFVKNRLTEHARKVLECISNLLSTFHSMARGTQACINASSTVSGIIGDLDTTIMFASAGTLNSDEKESFSDHRENILKTAKALVEDTKTLVSGAATNQEMLAGAAQNAVMTITKLADCVKHGAASLGSDQTEAQVLLINAVKDVASALADLIDATKNASGKLPSESSMGVLKDSAKVMVTNVTSLLKTVKTVEDEAVRGTQALESSIEVIGQEIKSYTSVDHVETKVTADDLIRLTRPVTTATARAVAAGNSCQQSDVISAANLGRKAITDLLKACKGGSVGVTDPSIKRRLLEAGHACGVAFRQLLVQINQALQQPSSQHRQTISSASKEVAMAINDIVNSAEAIKEKSEAHAWMESVLEGTTESELLIASNSIEAALLKLNNAQSQVKRQQEGVTGGSAYESDIFDAARSIAAATCNLVKAASMAQRELVAQGKLGDVSGASDLEDDSQWSQGLVSAARLVAAATQNLCDAANAMMQGCAGEEKLISSAKQVASSTAQLLVACKVKADPSSVAMRRLQSAGNAVKRATEALVQEAQKFKSNTNVDADVTVDERMVSGMAQLIMAQEDILIKEKQLESARKKLELMRRAKYKDREWDSTDSGTDF